MLYGQMVSRPRRPGRQLHDRLGSTSAVTCSAKLRSFCRSWVSREVGDEPQQHCLQRLDRPDRQRRRDGAEEDRVLPDQLRERARVQQLQGGARARLLAVADRQDDRVPGRHVPRELAHQRPGGERPEAPWLIAIQQHVLWIALRAEMAMVAQMQGAIEMNRQQQGHADGQIDDEIVDPAVARDQAVHAVMVEHQDRVLSGGYEERGRKGDGSGPPADRRRCSRGDDDPLDAERGDRWAVEPGAGGQRSHWAPSIELRRAHMPATATAGPNSRPAAMSST